MEFDVVLPSPIMEKICLFCGNTMKTSYDDCFKYHYCTCDDFKLNEEINEKIKELEWKRPREKYEIVERKHLIKK